MRSTSRLFYLCLCFFAFIALAFPQNAAATPKLEIEGIITHEAPLVVNGRLLVPVRTIVEGLGATASWDKAREAVIITDGPRVIELFVGKDVAMIQGASQKLEVPPRIYKGRTYLPLRFVSEALQAYIAWDKPTETAAVYRGTCNIASVDVIPSDNGIILRLSGDKVVRVGKVSKNATDSLLFQLPLTELPMGIQHISVGLAGIDSIELAPNATTPGSAELFVNGQVSEYSIERHGNYCDLRFPYQITAIEWIKELPYPALNIEGNGPIPSILSGANKEFKLKFPHAAFAENLDFSNTVVFPVSKVVLSREINGSLLGVALSENVNAKMIASEDGKALVVSFSPHLKNIKTEKAGSGTLLKLTATSGLNYEYEINPVGKTVVFDFKFLNWDKISKVISVNNGNVIALQIKDSPQFSQGVRIVATLKAPGGYKIIKNGDNGEFVAEIMASPVYGKLIAIDAGHGGADSGAVAISGKKEKNYNQVVAQQVIKLLEDAGAKVLEIRPGDSTVTLQERTDKANAANAAIYVSIHHNSILKPEIFGTESYYYPGKDDGRQLAELIHSQVIKLTGANDRLARSKDLFVLRTSTMPAALVEVRYLSNIVDEQAASVPANQANAAQGIYNGIVEYFRILNQ